MSVVRELVTRWGFQIDAEPLEKLEGLVDGVKSAVKVAGAAAVGAAATMFGLAKATAAVGDAMLQTATELGLSSRTIQELGYAAQVSGGSMEGMNAALETLSRNLYESIKIGSQQAYLFRRIGVATRDASGQLRSADAVLLDLADRFSSMPNGPRKTAMAMELLGGSAGSLLPLLNKGSAGLRSLSEEARRSGSILSDETIEASRAFNGELSRLWISLKGVALQVGAGLLPVIRALVTQVRGVVVANREVIKQGMAAAIRLMTAYLVGLFKAFVSLVNFIRGSIDIIDRMARSIGGINTVLRALSIVMGLFGLYRLGRTVYDIASAFYKMAAAAAAGWGATLLGPLLIGAAILALYLIIDDLIAWIQGRPSVLGALFKNSDVVVAKAKKLLDAFWSKCKDVMHKATVAFLEWTGMSKASAEDTTRKLGAWFAEAGDVIGDVIAWLVSEWWQFCKETAVGINYVVDHFDDVVSAVKKVWAWFQKLRTNPLSAMGDLAKSIAGALGSAMGAIGSTLGKWIVDPIISVIDAAYDAIGAKLLTKVKGVAHSIGSFFGFNWFSGENAPGAASTSAGVNISAPGATQPASSLGSGSFVGPPTRAQLGSAQAGPISATTQVTVHVDAGATNDPKALGQKVADAVRDHVDRTLRQTFQTTQSAIAR